MSKDDVTLNLALALASDLGPKKKVWKIIDTMISPVAWRKNSEVLERVNSIKLHCQVESKEPHPKIVIHR